jgi:hypothetical protein
LVTEITLSFTIYRQINWRVWNKATFFGGEAGTLKALVITPNEKTTEFGSLLAIARTEARKREQSNENPPIRALRYFPELFVYVAVYEAVENPVEGVKQKG